MDRSCRAELALMAAATTITESSHQNGVVAVGLRSVSQAGGTKAIRRSTNGDRTIDALTIVAPLNSADHRRLPRPFPRQNCDDGDRVGDSCDRTTIENTGINAIFQHFISDSWEGHTRKRKYN